MSKIVIKVRRISLYWEVTARSTTPIKNKLDWQYALKAWGDGHVVGHAVFGMRDGALRATMTEVVASYQRRGIATAMYQAVQRQAGMRVGPSWEQTPDSQALWEKLRTLEDFTR